MSKLKISFTLLGVALLSSLVPLAYICNFKDLPISQDSQIWGTFGDYFGGILNPILSFLAFSVLLINLYIQIKQNHDNDLRHERTEIGNRINNISPILLEIHNKIQRNLAAYPARSAPTIASNMRHNGSNTIYWNITDDLTLIYRFLLQIQQLDNESPFLAYYRAQYSNSCSFLNQRGYISEEISNFFQEV